MNSLLKFPIASNVIHIAVSYIQPFLFLSICLKWSELANVQLGTRICKLIKDGTASKGIFSAPGSPVGALSFPTAIFLNDLFSFNDIQVVAKLSGNLSRRPGWKAGD